MADLRRPPRRAPGSRAQRPARRSGRRGSRRSSAACRADHRDAGRGPVSMELPLDGGDRQRRARCGSGSPPGARCTTASVSCCAISPTTGARAARVVCLAEDSRRPGTRWSRAASRSAPGSAGTCTTTSARCWPAWPCSSGRSRSSSPADADLAATRLRSARGRGPGCARPDPPPQPRPAAPRRWTSSGWSVPSWRPDAPWASRCAAGTTVTRLSPAAEVAAYRIATEAVLNAHRHGQADEVGLDIRTGRRPRWSSRSWTTGPGLGGAPAGVGLAVDVRARGGAGRHPRA